MISDFGFGGPGANNISNAYDDDGYGGTGQGGVLDSDNDTPVASRTLNSALKGHGNDENFNVDTTAIVSSHTPRPVLKTGHEPNPLAYLTPPATSGTGFSGATSATGNLNSIHNPPTNIAHLA